MPKKIEKIRLAILEVLRYNAKPLSSANITEELVALGHEISGRTVRLYLKKMEHEGLTENVGKRKRVITDLGLDELESSRTFERVGFLSAKIDHMTYGMSFDLMNKSGTVVVNITFVEPKELDKRVDMICEVYENGYAMGHLLALLGPGERSLNTTVPSEMIGVCTVCSISINGVLLKYGIPTTSRFGGLLDIYDKTPTRFAEIITYDGTSIDPLEVFIRSGMTDYIGAIRKGKGRIGVSFREFPADSRDLVEDISHKLKLVGLGGFMAIGRAGRPLLDIPVSEGRVGAIIIGGLNPMSILEETGLRVNSRAMSGLLEFNKLFRYEELGSRMKAFL